MWNTKTSAKRRIKIKGIQLEKSTVMMKIVANKPVGYWSLRTYRF